MLKMTFVIFMTVVCKGPQLEAEKDTIRTPTISPQKDRPTNSSNYFGLKCHPDTVFSGDTLWVEMNVPNPGWLAIIGPNGSFNYVSRPKFEQNETHRPIVYLDDLANMKRLPLRTDSASVFDKVLLADRLIFDRTGVYKIQLGEFLGDATIHSQIDIYHVYFFSRSE